MAHVQLKGIFKSFGKEKVLHDINLEAASGGFLVLVGPSGCGKSTLLRIIAGLEAADQGEVWINGKAMTHMPPQHRNVAMVFQNYALYPHKNVRENLLFGIRKSGFPKKLMEERLERVAGLLQLNTMLDKKPGHLSGGQQQRVAMGRAIIRDVAVLLFDEPLSNLDAKLRRRMRREIKIIHQNDQRTCVYVTHDQVEAMTLGDQIAVIKDGTIQQVGTPMDVYLHPANLFVAEFVGAPPMNVFDVLVHKDWMAVDGHRILFSGPSARRLGDAAQGMHVKMGIRPDFLQDQRLVEKKESWGILENAMVTMVEPLGHDQEVELTLGMQRFIAKLNFKTRVREGDLLNLCFDWNRVLFFDAKTGSRIALPV